MTLRLILIRHAKSDWGSPALPDHERPLNARGRLDAPRMGAWIAAQGASPDEVLCSDAVRTRATLDLMLPAFAPAPRVSTRADLYHAEPEAMLKALSTATGATIAVVAHNPGIGALAALLARQAPDHPRWEDYPTSAVTILAFDGPIAEAQGDVTAFAVPSDLELDKDP